MDGVRREKRRVRGKEIVDWLLDQELVVRNYKKWWLCSEEDMGVEKLGMLNAQISLKLYI